MSYFESRWGPLLDLGAAHLLNRTNQPTSSTRNKHICTANKTISMVCTANKNISTIFLGELKSLGKASKNASKNAFDLFIYLST